MLFMVMVEFQQEAAVNVFDEVLALSHAHRAEIHHYQDLEISPNKQSYIELDDMKQIAVFTARLETSQLVGYAVFNIRPSPHFKNTLQAFQDLVYLAPEYRGHGRDFLKWCDKALKSLDVSIVYHFTKTKRDFGPVLESLGYEHVETVFARRL